MASSLASSSRAAMPAAAAAPAPVVRHGFVIPSIRLTPPDSRPAKSPECPEQDLSNTTLYVPLRTEEIGWEEGGVIWGGKRPVYAYPTVNLYGGDDDHVIGTYRGGPKGYSFFTITDPNFSAESSSDDCEEIAPPPRKAHDEPRPRRETSDEIESDRGSSSSSSSSRGRSSSRASDSASSASSSSTSSEAALPKTPLPLAPISTEALPKAPITDAICTSSPTNLNEGSIDEALSSAPASVCCSTPGSSAASSRRGSSSSDTDSGADTGATTPASPPCDAAVDKTIADLGAQLETRLSALSRADVDDEESSRPRKTMKLAGRVGGGDLEESSTAPLKDAARLSASFELDASAPGAQRTWPAGRGTSRQTAATSAFSGGSEYEANFV